MIRSDDFGGAALAAFWTEYIGDGATTIGVGGGNLLINSTDATTFSTADNDGSCVVQPAPGDFDVELGVGVLPTVNGQECGLIALDDPVNPQNYLCFGPRFSVTFRLVHRHATLGGGEVDFFDAAPPVTPNALRLRRAGDVYSAEVSADGSTWVGVAGGSWATPLPFVGVYTIAFFGAPFASQFPYFLNLNQAVPNAPIFGASV